MILKIIDPNENHASTIYGNVHKVIEDPNHSDDIENAPAELQITHDNGHEHTIPYETGWAFLMNDNGDTIDRL